jgi:hypothetical protein
VLDDGCDLNQTMERAVGKGNGFVDYQLLARELAFHSG